MTPTWIARAGDEPVSGFEIVAIVIALFFGFGIATGVLLVLAVTRSRTPRHLEDRHRHLPGDGTGPPLWPDA
jgi:hypothetical protein